MVCSIVEFACGARIECLAKKGSLVVALELWLNLKEDEDRLKASSSFQMPRGLWKCWLLIRAKS